MIKYGLCLLVSAFSFSYAQSTSHNNSWQFEKQGYDCPVGYYTTYEKNNNSEKKSDDTSIDEKNPKSPHTFSANVSIVSDYRFRGISQTMRHPAIQGGFDYSHESGIYLGTWASNTDGTCNYYNNTSMEWDFYGGFKGKLLQCTLFRLSL